MDRNILESCWKKFNNETKVSWDELANLYGYNSGEALRSVFKRYRKRLNRTTAAKKNIENKIELVKATDSNIEDYTLKDHKANFITKSNNGKPRLVISDLHLPFAVDGWLDFIVATHKKFDCDDEIIINGDLWDFHQYSFHTSETDAYSGVDEFDKAYQETKKLANIFPNVRLTLGNHDMLLVRRIKELGIDKRFTKTLHELFDLPSTWIIAEDFIIDDVYYRHVGCAGGRLGHINSAISNRMSTVSSHLHAYGGIGYVTSPSGEMIFGLNTGALCDDEAYAFRYGKLNRYKATLGCGVVFNFQNATFVPFSNTN